MSKESPHPRTLVSSRPRALGFWVSAALILGLCYLAVSAWGFGFSGFPLDDAWIHQTYARNLARSGQLAFVPGVPSAGSTAPLWSFLLSLGYLVGIPFKIWTYGLGLILLGLTAWTVTRLSLRLFPEQPGVGLWAGLFCLFEWHLIWAAVSGMETILFVWLSLFLVERYVATKRMANQRIDECSDGNSPFAHSPFAGFGLGLIGGLLILTRPEGLGLVGLVGLDMAYNWWRQRRELLGTEGTAGNSKVPGAPTSSYEFPLLRAWLWLAAGVVLLLAPYIAFHLWATGLPFPNTFYAKQAEYRAILDHFPLWQRLFGTFGEPVETVQGVFRVIFTGAQFLLLPGLLFAAWLAFKERRTGLILIWLWWVSFLLLYGLRLPVTYQHGRYQIPAIAWVILLGVWGTARLLQKMPDRNVALRALSRAWVLSLAVLALAFTAIGAQAYGRDVRFIESEMVVTARWLDSQTPPDALIAAHDIGAIGYFAQRPLIDLAGLITPEVIPIIRNEAALLDFIRSRQADYLVTFPSWYPELTRNSKLSRLYSTGSSYAPQAGSDNMTVYKVSQ
ncbi:MAG: hypothetical protein BroJett011_55050 [Chloroflexota bacterium]|nr:MAG: hypothetical protein BroJett011_55050 [Chloroflexota bacterium]